MTVSKLNKSFGIAWLVLAGIETLLFIVDIALGDDEVFLRLNIAVLSVLVGTLYLRLSKAERPIVCDVTNVIVYGKNDSKKKRRDHDTP